MADPHSRQANGDDPTTDVCRILVLGSHRNRLEKVFSILRDMQQEELAAQEGTDPADGQHQQPRIEFLAAVATFDAYADGEGQMIRYLVTINYFPSLGEEGKLATAPHSLVPFLDEQAPITDTGVHNDSFYGITSAVVGGGLDGKADGAKIQKVLATLSPLRHVPVVCLQAASDFESMRHELAAYRALDADSKAEATRNRTMGPGKVAQFAMDTAATLIGGRQEQRRAREEAAAAVEAQPVSDATTPVLPTTADNTVDPHQTRYACKKCRTILFGQDALEDPPHLAARHDFTRRKGNLGGARMCQSLFLQSAPSWAGDDASLLQNEGKIACPKCATKVGHWNWAGAQCSCGTWVCPAIQIPSSRVDEMLPPRPAADLPTVVSPFLANLLQQQQQQPQG
jgi:dual specificity phosphatase 12